MTAAFPSVAERRSDNGREQRKLLDNWHTFERPALRRMLEVAGELLSALDDYRATQMWARDLVRHDAYAVDHIGGLLDHLSDEIGCAQKRADEMGVSVEAIELDRSELMEAHAMLKKRAEARGVRIVRSPVGAGELITPDRGPA